MRSRFSTVVVFVCGLMLAVPGLARENARPVLSIVSNSVGTPSYDAQGRLVRMESKRFDAAGNYVGVSVHSHEWNDKGQLIGTEYASFDADDLQVSRIVTAWDLTREGIVRWGDRVFHDGTDAVVRTEEEVWRQDPNEPISTIQTRTFDAEGALEKTRYDVTERDTRGRLQTRDVSVYDADNVQVSRAFERWTYDGPRVTAVKRYAFDERDDVLTVEDETRRYDARQKVVAVDKVRRDGEGIVLARVHETRGYDGDGRLNRRVVTFADANDLALRRMVEEVAHDAQGRLAARRVAWEYLK